MNYLALTIVVSIVLHSSTDVLVARTFDEAGLPGWQQRLQQHGRRLRGKVRQEFSTIQPGVLSLGVSAGAEGGENVQPPTQSSTAQRPWSARKCPPPCAPWLNSWPAPTVVQ